MIPLKKCNYITGDTNSVSYAVNRIVRFLEDDGRNPLLFAKPKSSSSKNTTLRYLIDNKIEFNDFFQFKSLLNDDGNLFRVDLLVFDFWHLSSNSIKEYQYEIDKLNIDYIIVTKEYYYKTSDDVNDYHIISDSKKSGFQTEYWITDKITGWTSNLDDLTKSYIRDKKINQVINKSDEEL